MQSFLPHTIRTLSFKSYPTKSTDRSLASRGRRAINTEATVARQSTHAQTNNTNNSHVKQYIASAADGEPIREQIKEPLPSLPSLRIGSSAALGYCFTDRAFVIKANHEAARGDRWTIDGPIAFLSESTRDTQTGSSIPTGYRRNVGS